MGFEDKFKSEYGNVEAMLEDCQEAARCSNHKFSKWDLDFIDSVLEQFEERGGLTVKQEETLEKIWEKI